MPSILSDLDEQTLVNVKVLIQEIYQNKCAHPTVEHILNCLYELQDLNLALLVHQLWNKEDAVFGSEIRKRFKQDFLEFSEVEAFEELGGIQKY